MSERITSFVEKAREVAAPFTLVGLAALSGCGFGPEGAGADAGCKPPVPVTTPEDPFGNPGSSIPPTSSKPKDCSSTTTEAPRTTTTKAPETTTTEAPRTTTTKAPETTTTSTTVLSTPPNRPEMTIQVTIPRDLHNEQKVGPTS